MLSPVRYRQITSSFARLRIAVVGDFCLDRYLEIDPAKEELSLETGLAVHNVVNVRAQPGGAGTILNNLSALRVGHIYPVGFCGDNGEGYELMRGLRQLPGTQMDGFLQTSLRRTFTYCKPLKMWENRPPEELHRLDSKNWTPTPSEVSDELTARLNALVERLDAMVVLDQVDVPQTGVVTARVLEHIARIAEAFPQLPIIADSRRGLEGFPPVCFKMNATELARMVGCEPPPDLRIAADRASELARRNQRHVFVTMSERGMVGASPDGAAVRVAALPPTGPIDIVGAGDCVTANLATGLAAGATLDELLEVARAAAFVVIHQLGTTGTASPEQIEACLRPSSPS
jgi:rfaE bifunctional protein kinase chain/domain